MKPNLDKLVEQGYEEQENGFYIILRKGRRRIVYDFKKDVVVERYFKLKNPNHHHLLFHASLQTP